MKILAAIAMGLATITSASASVMVTDPTCDGGLHGIASNSFDQPVPDIQVMLWPVGVDLSYVLPRTTTSDGGEYWFEHVCAGRFTVVGDDEESGYPPSFWTYVLGDAQEVELTAESLQVEVPVVVPEKAASVMIIARDHHTNATIQVIEVRLSASKASSVTINHNSSEPLLLPARTDLACHLVADGYREWPDKKRGAKHLRLSPEDHITLNVNLEPRR